MKFKRLTNSQWEVIKWDIAHGESMAQIARDNGISRTALYQYAYRHGWIRKKNDTIWSRLSRYFKVGREGNQNE